jgi:hypothetical protein
MVVEGDVAIVNSGAFVDEGRTMIGDGDSGLEIR